MVPVEIETPQYSFGAARQAERQRWKETADKDSTSFDTVTRLFSEGMPRREALRGLVAGAAALFASGALLSAEDAAAREKRRKAKKSKGAKNKNTNKDKKKKTQPTTVPETEPQPQPEPNPCDGKNWCLDRSQTCGPEGGYGKCLVEAGGGNICAEILFQVASCTECESPNCTNCRCVLAAGGDRCNNGSTGYDFICVRTE